LENNYGPEGVNEWLLDRNVDFRKYLNEQE
jgi:hypothetical protein